MTHWLSRAAIGTCLLTALALAGCSKGKDTGATLASPMKPPGHGPSAPPSGAGGGAATVPGLKD